MGRSHREEFRPTRQSIRARKLYNETAVKYYIPAEPDGCGQLTRPFRAERLGKWSGARDYVLVLRLVVRVRQLLMFTAQHIEVDDHLPVFELCKNCLSKTIDTVD